MELRIKDGELVLEEGKASVGAPLEIRGCSFFEAVVALEHAVALMKKLARQMASTPAREIPKPVVVRVGR